jgi:diguanylate cyclase (GGDEF)-like protein
MFESGDRNGASVLVIDFRKPPESQASADRRMAASAPARPRARHSRKQLFWMVLFRIVMAAAAVDVLFFIFFSVVGSRFQQELNVVSFSCYCLTLWLLKRRHNRLAIILIWAEVFTHAAIGTLLTGWDSGYYYYLLMFVPTIIVSTPRRAAYWMLAALWSFYLALFLVMQHFPPIEPISRRALFLLQAFNETMLFAMVSYFVFMYQRLATASDNKLNLLATTDPLTGLFNRRYALETAMREAALFDRGSRALSYILADIDHFKLINDRLGHQAGDAALIAVSEALRSVARVQDVLARWGGEEFLFVLPDTPREGAADLAARIRDVVARLAPIPGIGPLTLTFGVSAQRKHETCDAAIARADKALYHGKRAGRNRVMLEQEEDEATPAQDRAAD